MRKKTKVLSPVEEEKKEEPKAAAPTQDNEMIAPAMPSSDSLSLPSSKSNLGRKQTIAKMLEKEEKRIETDS